MCGLRVRRLAGFGTGTSFQASAVAIMLNSRPQESTDTSLLGADITPMIKVTNA
jgi:hypothetical protein